MNEEWKDVIGYEGLYQVSNYGRMRSLDRIVRKGSREYMKEGQILSCRKNKYGYLHLQLAKDGISKDYVVHRLVAIAFISNPYRYAQINHIDEVKDNNNVDNLEWCSAAYNNNYGTRNARVSETLMNKYLMC